MKIIATVFWIAVSVQAIALGMTIYTAIASHRSVPAGSVAPAAPVPANS